MKVAVYQTSPVLLDLKANLEDVISKIHQGREKGAHLIVFPELALTGYFVGQKYHKMTLDGLTEEQISFISDRAPNLRQGLRKILRLVAN
jgi:predicted amidohydrolase